MFSEESLKNRQELSERLSRDVKEDYERKLAGQNRLSAPGGDMYSALQGRLDFTCTLQSCKQFRIHCPWRGYVQCFSRCILILFYQ